LSFFFLIFILLLDRVENENDESIGSDTLIDKSFAISTPKLSNEADFGLQRIKFCEFCESQLAVTRKALQIRIDETKSSVSEFIDENIILIVGKNIINHIVEKTTDSILSK